MSLTQEVFINDVAGKEISNVEVRTKGWFSPKEIVVLHFSDGTGVQLRASHRVPLIARRARESGERSRTQTPMNDSFFSDLVGAQVIKGIAHIEPPEATGLPLEKLRMFTFLLMGPNGDEQSLHVIPSVDDAPANIRWEVRLVVKEL